MLIRARAPLRLGLAGGGTDVSPYCDLHGGYVLNATIDRYAYAVVSTHSRHHLRFVATDSQVSRCYPPARFVEFDGALDLHKAVYNEVVERFNGGRPLGVELSTFCDAPPGSGLGSSSTLVVVMLKAFTQLLNVKLSDYELARLAFKIERIDCELQGGRQDQYAATFGGFNFMEFHPHERVVVHPLGIADWIVCELEACLVLYYSGVSRASARIIADQAENVRSGVTEAINAMHAIKDEALSMRTCLLKGDFQGVVDSMRAGWESKKRSARSVSSAEIEEIYRATCHAGALAGKISGAGGGGYMLFLVPPDKRMDVCRTLKGFGGEVSNCHFTRHGTQSWLLHDESGAESPNLRPISTLA